MFIVHKTYLQNTEFTIALSVLCVVYSSKINAFKAIKCFIYKLLVYQRHYEPTFSTYLEDEFIKLHFIIVKFITKNTFKYVFV